MTRKLFYDNSKLLEFQTQVIKTKIVDGIPAICLEDTAFYPTSGGQPFDIGFINDIKVTNVWEEGEDIWHQVDGFPTNEVISGSVDWTRRFDHMQQHTGQHLLSAVIFNEFQSNTIGFHIGPDTSTIDLDIQKLTMDAIAIIENMVNSKVWDNYPIEIKYPSNSEIQKLAFRKPPKYFKNIRVIQIGDYDICSCGGTHVNKTGEIGTIKITHIERYKGGIRLTFLCGNRAIKDYQKVHRIIKKTSARLSIHPDDLPNAIERLIDDVDNNHQAYNKIQKDFLLLKADQMWGEAEIVGEIKRITTYSENLTFSDLKILANILRDRPKTLILLATSNGDKINLLCTKSKDLDDFDANDILKDALIRLQGKGGGTSEMAQGGAPMVDSNQINQVLMQSIRSI